MVRVSLVVGAVAVALSMSACSQERAASDESGGERRADPPAVGDGPTEPLPPEPKDPGGEQPGNDGPTEPDPNTPVSSEPAE